MTLRDILIFLGAALALRLLAAGVGRMRPNAAAAIHAWKNGFLFAASVLALFWLQPSMPVRNLDFWLPLGTLALAVWGWILTSPGAEAPGKLAEASGKPGEPPASAPADGSPVTAHRSRLSPFWRENLPWLGAAAGIVLLVAATRFLSPTGVITASRPPQFELVLAGLLLVGLIAAGLVVGRKGDRPVAPTITFLILFLLLLFLVLKTPALAQSASAGLRGLMGQPVTNAGPLDLRWLGFSYIAFRLIHTLRERQLAKANAKVRSAPANFREYLTYLVFFPALTAGPIDRVERFVKDLRAPLPALSADLYPAGERLALGLFKKFVLAGSLALFSLSAENIGLIHGAGWMGLALVGYALQIYFDFSGYTDIAIGLGRLLGVQLPENFNAPYLKPNLTQFWNNWHMTLTQWFRAYFFNPVTRWMRGREWPMGLVILTTQLATFVLIGLWHGVTWNFVIWGAWHGLGIFAQNRWSEFVKPRMEWLEEHPRLKSVLAALGALATFVYVSLGWVWFALPEPADALRVLGVLFGLSN